MPQPTKKMVLDAHAALPEAYQPAWGLDESRSKARRACDDRLAYLLELTTSFDGDGPLRILDIGCAQGYFALALKQELEKLGRAVEVVGVDYLEENVDFCRMLAAHHRVEVRFIHDSFDAMFFERQGLVDFDFILALNVLHHVRQLDGEQAATTALESISQHTNILACELAQPEEALDWIGSWHESDSDLLAPFAFRRRLATFETHLTKVKRPLYVCSNHYAYVGSSWFSFERSIDRAHAGVPDRFAGQRRFFIGNDVVIKCYRGEGDYAAFNRAELAAELSALTALRDEPERYPQILAHADDGDLIWFVRGKLPGTLLSELIDAGQMPDRHALVVALLKELVHLESRGFHHFDLRAWNILWHQDVLYLIDFGSVATKGAPLNRVALAALLAELSCGKLDHGPIFYCTLRALEIYPLAWQPLLRYLLGEPERDFRYKEALAIFLSALAKGEDGHALHAYGNLAVCPEVLEESSSEQVRIFQRLNQHIEDLEARFGDAQGYAGELQQVLQKMIVESAEERRILQSSLEEATVYAQSLKKQLEREASDAEAERKAAKLALDEASQYAQSLHSQLQRVEDQADVARKAAEAALDEASQYARSLQKQLDREAGEAEEERKAAKLALDEATQYAQSLQERLEREAREADEERKAAKLALDDASQYAQSLQEQLARQQCEADAARQAAEVALDEASRHARSLQEQLERQQCEADTARQAAEVALDEASRYAQSLQDQLEREACEAETERKAAKLALDEAAQFAESLQNHREREVREGAAEREVAVAALNKAEEYAQSLQAQLDRQESEADAARKAAEVALYGAEQYTNHLRAQLEREASKAQAERKAAEVSLEEAIAQINSLESLNSKLVSEQAVFQQKIEKADTRYLELKQDHDRLRRRFRLLSPLMPKGTHKATD